MPHDPRSQTLRLPDGRLLGYARFGCKQGHPLLYFHGLPGSRHECGLLHGAAEALGLQVLALDRPGYGLSSPQPGRRLSQWPGDVTAFADALGIERFSIVGVSGGGPCALACARLIPGRIASTAVVCGLGPVAEPRLRRAMSWHARLAFYLAGSSPAALQALYGTPLHLLARLSPAFAMRVLAYHLGPPDRDLLLAPQVLELLSRNLRAAFRQGAGGALQDVAVYRAAWGFEVRDISLPVHFWHGDADPIVPLQHSEYLKARLPGSRLTVVPGEGHFSLPVLHAERILRALCDAARGTPAP